MAQDEGVTVVDRIMAMINSKYEVHNESLGVAMLAVTLNHAMLMSSCIFCNDMLVPEFSKMTPEVGFRI